MPDAGSMRIEPGPGQESVWDYPRPPRIEISDRRVQVKLGGAVIADTTRAKRVLETAGAPVWYLPPEDVMEDHLRPHARRTYCEWKGQAEYFTVRADGQSADAAAFTYRDPTPGFRDIAGYYGFYPGALECYVDGEKAAPQPGGYYAGWVTSDIVGPFKGEPGTEHW